MTPNPYLTRLSAWHARHRWVLDAVIVAAIVGLDSLQIPRGGEELAGWLFTVALALPLLWRRRWPVAVFAVMAGIAFVQWLVDVKAVGDIALLVGLYTVASTRRLPITIAAAALLEFGIVIASVRWGANGTALSAITGLTGLATAAAVLGLNARHRRALLATLEDRAARLEIERDQQGQLAAAAERSRIAREMHDVVAHNLSVMVALADGATFAVHDAPETAELAMRNASRTGREALAEMRQLLGVLREDEPSARRAPQPGIDDLAVLLEQVRAAGLPTTLTVTGSPHRETSNGLQLAAYRIVQEALTNALKHGGPDATASVTLRWEPPCLELAVTSTGHPVPLPATDGGGLPGMRQRAAVYDGDVTAGPRHGGGWSVVARLVQPASTAVPA